MRPDEYEQFAEMISSVAEAHSHTLSAGAIRVYWSALADLSLEQVSKALLAHERNPHEGKFMPVPAAIRREFLLAIDDGRPGPEEAWGIAVRTMSQDYTVFLTDEIMWARDVAWPIYQEGDRVGARKAFLEKYESLLQTFRSPPNKVRWWPSLGHDPYDRETAVIEAVQLGRIRAEDARKYLPYHGEQSQQEKALLAPLSLPAADGDRTE